MAYDGIVTKRIVEELSPLIQGKIDKIQQPTRSELLLTIHTRNGNAKLYASSGSSDPRLHLTQESIKSPSTPPPFCMLLRKHLGGARITDIRQVGCDRIIEIYFEAVNELGFTVSKKLVFEIMGKHSNIILIDLNTGKVLDSIKRVSIDTSRARQVLPGALYEYPPSQDKIPFSQITEEDLAGLEKNQKAILNKIGGISPQVAESIAESDNSIYQDLMEMVSFENLIPHVYLDESDNPLDFHIANLKQYENTSKRIEFQDLSSAISYYFDNKSATNRLSQMSHDLTRHVSTLLDKSRLKLQRLNEDLLEAENSDKYRLYGELLTANLHMVKPGDQEVKVISYYDGSEVAIPLDPKLSPSANAQANFKKYGKAKTAIKEKKIQIEETEKDILYLDSVLNALDNLDKPEDIDTIRSELTDEGYLKRRKSKEKPGRFKASPHKYISPSGYTILVGRNNKENDELTLKIADRQDLWLHTKDIPGSHVILRTEGNEATPEDIHFAAAIAAWHSKAKNSAQVPVDYVRVRNVKKPSGAKPGMVIFTNNRTVYVTPKVPE